MTEMKNIFINKEIRFTDDLAINKAKEILGTHYDGLYQFFCKRFFKFENNTYTILVTRRCSVVASWFFTVLISRLKDDIFDMYNITQEAVTGLICIENKKTNCKNYIVTEKYIKSLDEKTVNTGFDYNIVDDICIHGRGLNIVKNELIKILHNSETSVKTWAYLASVDSIVENIDEIEKKSSANAWKKLSNSLVDLITYLNIPYVSYLNSYMRFDVSPDDFIQFVSSFENDNRFIVKEFSSERQENFGKKSFIIFDRTEINSCEQYRTCRIYYNKKTFSLALVPYVLLRKDNYNELLANEENKKFLEYFKDDAFSLKDKQEYTYMLLTCYKSNGFAEELFQCIEHNSFLGEKWGRSKWVEDYFSLLKFTFGPFADKLNNYTTIDANLTKIKAKEDLNEQIVLDNSVNKIIANKWLNDEINACYLLGKNDAINVSQILNNGNKQYAEFVELISACDQGFAHITVKSVAGKAYSVVDAGELGVSLIEKGIYDCQDEYLVEGLLSEESGYYKSLLR